MTTLPVQSLPRIVNGRLRRLAILIVVVTCAVSTGTRAAELVEQAHSLRAVPADAAFYSASLRLKEQLDIFLASKTYQRLMEIPIVQLAKLQLTFQWQQAAVPQVAKFKQYVESPEGQDAVALLKDMFAEEMFMYGSHDVTAVLQLFMDLNGVRQTAQVEAAARGEEAEDVTAERALEVLKENADKLKVPSIVVGWRINDAKRAERQLDALHSLTRNLLDEHRPELSAHLQREQIGGHEFLALRLDGSMIPWDELREKAEDMDDEQFEAWRKLVSDKSVAVALGIIDEFVLLSVGDSTAHLETFGQGESLQRQAAFMRLQKHAGERVASIGYMSKAFAESLSSPERTVRDLTNTAQEFLDAAEVTAEQRAELVKELDALGIEMQKYLPAPGDAAGISYLTSRGYEGYQYRSSAQPMWDSSQSLSLLSHVGGEPMLFIAARSKENPEDYDAAAEWIKRVAIQVEKIAESKADPEDWAEYQEYRDRGVALLKRLDRATREHFIPAFMDGQSAVVVDTAVESKQWSDKMPESPNPLPMLEMAVVLSVGDAEHLRQGTAELVDIVGDAIALAREINPDDFPEFELPDTQKRDVEGGGTLYVYRLPEAWGIDEQIAFNAGLTDRVAVLSASPQTTERLLRGTPLKVDTALDVKRPAAVVTHFQVADIVTAITPWIDYGFDVATGKLKLESAEDENAEDEEEDDEAKQQQAAIVMQMGFVMPQVKQFLNVTTALRSTTSVTYEEDGVWVTRSEVHLEDLK